jgi:hypothetical protein
MKISSQRRGEGGEEEGSSHRSCLFFLLTSLGKENCWLEKQHTAFTADKRADTSS